MRELLVRMMDGFKHDKEGVFAGNSVASLFTKELPEALYGSGYINRDLYIAKGSVGQGNWAQIPWVCVFDKEITTSATKGVYVAFLFSADGDSLFLTLIQGMSEARNSLGIKKANELMRKNAVDIATTIDRHDFQDTPKIVLGNNLTTRALMYQESTILYKQYLRNSMPDEKAINEDIKNVFSIYTEYKNKFMNLTSTQSEWFPSIEDYDPHITKEKWITLLNNPEFINPERAAILAAFHAEGDSATCLQLAEKYQQDAPSISGSCTAMSKKIADLT